MSALMRRAALARMTKLELIDLLAGAQATAVAALKVTREAGDIGYASGALGAVADALGITSTDRENGAER